MQSRNVIISLILVLAMLTFIFIRIRNEPRKKLSFNRNPSRIEYSHFALCRMDCYNINANSIISMFRNGTIESRKPGKTCTTFTLHTMTKQEKSIFLTIEQCGTVAKVIDCFMANREMPCPCIDAENRPISLLKSN